MDGARALHEPRRSGDRPVAGGGLRGLSLLLLYTGTFVCARAGAVALLRLRLRVVSGLSRLGRRARLSPDPLPDAAGELGRVLAGVGRALFRARVSLRQPVRAV